MYQIRNGVFETNSSSTHSICISKTPVKNLPEFVRFVPGEYGWENVTVNDTASYLWEAILDGPPLLVEPRKERLTAALDRLGVKYSFKYPPKSSNGKWYEYGYIDHAYECADLIEALLSNDDLLARYLFGDSFINTGNDNQDDDPSGCDIADEYYWDDEKHCDVPNPYHDPEHYTYFSKGN